MTSDPLADLGHAYIAAGQREAAEAKLEERHATRRKAARAERVEMRPQVHEAMVEAAKAGRRPVDIGRLTGYTRERVRQILRAGGVEPAADEPELARERFDDAP